VEDLNILVEISRNTFIDAFEKDNDPNDFRDYINNAFSKSSIKQQLINPESKFYFVYKNNSLVGYFKLNWGAAQSESFEKSLELERIYVLPQHQNQGLGRSFLQYIINFAKSKNFVSMWLGVWQKNESAVRFYKQHGFNTFGTHPYFIGKDKQTDWLMRLDLS
jgi:ribosomal protein S18 acetylase RimI-like enzyme